MTDEITFDQLIDGRFRLQSMLSYGGYGMVWKGWHENLKMPLAIKIVNVSSAPPDTVERVLRECAIGGSLRGTMNVVPVLDALREGDNLFIVMNLMPGGDLAKRIHGDPIPFDQALDWALTLCETLQQVHAKNIVHRDIKPQNILLDEHGHVKLCDFGIAYLGRSNLTTGSQPGTPGYKAPELDAGETATPAADVYSLCAVLFEVWTGLQYAEYRGFTPDVVRGEFLARLKDRHPTVSATCREMLADAILRGLAPLRNRAGLDQLSRELKLVQRYAAHQQQSAGADATAAPLRLLRPPSVSLIGREALPSEETTAANWVVEAVQQAFANEALTASHRTLFFWYDEKQEWSAIVPLLQERLPLIVDNGSLLEMRYTLEQRSESEPVVLYLTRRQEERSYLTPYELQGCRLDLGAYDLLSQHGVPLPISGQERKAIEPLIPQLLAASLGQEERFWESINSYDRAREKLLGDIPERLFRFLAAPSGTWADLQAHGEDQLFVDEIVKRFGYSNSDPEEWAVGLVARWCMVDLHNQFGQPATFPAPNLLPPPALRENCRQEWKRLRHDGRYLATARQLADEVERKYPDVVTWARKQPKALSDAPLYQIALIAWERTLEHIASVKEEQELVAYLDSDQPSFTKGAEGFWAKQGRLPGWKALEVGAGVIRAASQACQDSEYLQDPAAFIKAYTDKWWRIDREYRRYRSLPEVDTVAAPFTSWVSRGYRRYLEQVNRHWTAELAETKAWPPRGALEPQSTLWSSVEQNKGRRAVFFIDGLRLDLAQQIMEIVNQDSQTKVSDEFRLAGLPSITALGMAALLPKAGSQVVTWDQDWVITAPDAKGNLADKDARVQFLQRDLKNSTVMALEEMLRPQTRVADIVDRLLIFSTDIDALGENSAEVSFDALEAPVQRIVQGIRKALDAGFSTVHVVTDHGFLLLDDISESDKISPPDVQFLDVHQRYLVGRSLPERTDLLRFPIRGSNDLQVYCPFGIAAFVTPGRYQYSHGGPSLHEIVIPYLVARRESQRRPVNVRLTLPAEIHNAIFKIELHPEVDSLIDTERNVRVTIERDGRRLRDYEEVVTPGGPVSKNLRLNPADRIPRGSKIDLIVQDAHTGEELDRKSAIVQVELEL